MHKPPKTSKNTVADAEGIAYIGQRQLWDGQQLFGLHEEDRRQHTYIIGKTGSGKSTLLRNLLIQDIHAGRGVGLIDPHGDLAEDLLDHIPPSRIDDVVYFNPADTEHPISFNLFAGCDPRRRHLTASRIVTVFKSLWHDSWGPRMEYILSAAMAALLQCQNTSLLGVQRMLVDEPYRAWVLRQVRDPVIRSFWLDEFAAYDPRFLREAIAPIQNKVGQLLMSPPVRNVLGQVRNRVDLRFIMDHRRIFVANLSKGLLGEDKANLLGALLVSQFQQAALSRAALPEAQRTDFHLAIDEFQNYSTEAFASMLAESRKYRLAMLLVNQHLDQLAPGLPEAVFGNVGTFVAFRVSEKDAAVLSREFGGSYDRSLFSSLDNHRVCVKLLAGGRYGDPFLATTLPPLALRHGRSQSIIRRSRERHGAPREIVEDRIRRWLGGRRSVS